MKNKKNANRSVGAENASGGSGGDTAPAIRFSRFTRRRFLKRSGGATAAAMLAMHGMRVEVFGANGCPSGQSSKVIRTDYLFEAVRTSSNRLNLTTEANTVEAKFPATGDPLAATSPANYTVTYSIGDKDYDCIDDNKTTETYTWLRDDINAASVTETGDDTNGWTYTVTWTAVRTTTWS